MTFLVPFDGSDLAEAALVRATEFATVLGEDVLAVSVIPRGHVEYAVERGWLDADERYDLSRIVAALHEQVTDLCPSADFRHEVVGRYAPSGTIGTRLREAANEEGASMVFVGSENAGRLVASLSSVGSTVAAGDDYDVVIVRHRRPSGVDRVDDASPHRTSKSDFYLPD
jgi:nucleotide-binding universal stress UspA family protein